jgi:hypothetical protein
MFFVSDAATPRQEGGSPTGGTELMGQSAEQPAAPDPKLQQLLAAAQANPDDLAARVALARAHLEREDMMAVWNETQYVLEREPTHPEALAFQALVRLAMGQADIAEQMLKQSVASDPDQVDGYLHLALVYYRMGRVDEGAAIITDLRGRHPEQTAMLDRIAADLESQAGAGVAQADPHAGIGAQSDAPAPPPASAVPASGSGGARVAGVLELAPGLVAGPASTVFVIARPEGAVGGAPLAAKRMSVSTFPARFELSSADSMMGAELPERFSLEVRLDGDGDAMSKDASDPQTAMSVALGDTNLRLVLSR